MRDFDLLLPTATDEAVVALRRHRGARPLAGGTTLVDLMRLDVLHADTLVDVTRLPGMADVTEGADGELVIGALARMADVAEHPRVRDGYPALAESLSKAASQQVRNMATVAGNLLQRTRCAYFRSTDFPCNKRTPGSGCSAIDGAHRAHAVLGGSPHCIAVYPGDWAVALSAFEATVDVQGPRGERRLAVLDLHRLPGATPHVETVLAPGELVTAIRVPRRIDGRGSTYHKVRDRDAFAFALAAAAVALELGPDGRVRQARIAVGGVATKPWRDRRAEALVVGRPFSAEAAQRAAHQVFAAAAPRPHNAYKVALGIETVASALHIAHERARS